MLIRYGLAEPSLWMINDEGNSVLKSGDDNQRFWASFVNEKIVPLLKNKSKTFGAMDSIYPNDIVTIDENGHLKMPSLLKYIIDYSQDFKYKPEYFFDIDATLIATSGVATMLITSLIFLVTNK